MSRCQTFSTRSKGGLHTSQISCCLRSFLIVIKHDWNAIHVPICIIRHLLLLNTSEIRERVDYLTTMNSTQWLSSSLKQFVVLLRLGIHLAHVAFSMYAPCIHESAPVDMFMNLSIVYLEGDVSMNVTLANSSYGSGIRCYPVAWHASTCKW